MYEKASAAVAARQWGEAQRLFTRLDQEAPGYRDTAAQLNRIAQELVQATSAPAPAVSVATKAETTAAPIWAIWKPALVIGLGWDF